MKRCSTLIIKEIKFKTTVRDHSTVINRANINKKDKKQAILTLDGNVIEPLETLTCF